MANNLRWELYLPKDSVTVAKKENIVSIGILRPHDFETVSATIDKIKINNQYIKSLKTIKPEKLSDVPNLEIELIGDQVEIFSFYRDNESKQIIDFWINPDSVAKASAVKQETPKPERKIASIEKKKVNYPKKFLKPKVPDGNYRDFRYGAAFVWNYPPLITPPLNLINLESKTPDYFYPIRDLKIIDSEKLAHLQLSINLYRKAQFGLMNKSIDLYFKKYGEEADIDLNEFLKVNAILRLNKGDLEKESSKFAISMLNTISKRTSDYGLKKGILKYLVSSVFNKEDYVNTIKEARRLFILAKEYSDVDLITKLSSIILYSLAKLSQMDKIEEILKNPDYENIIPPQLALSYQTYILLSQDKSQEVINLFEKSRKSLVDPIHEGILFNVAESYFREGKYTEALENYEKFLKTYSSHVNSSMTKIRIALIHDLLSKDPEQVLAHYKDVIDGTGDFQVNFEARLRYVAFRNLRKKTTDQDDFESRAFLKLKPEEEKFLNEDLKKMLWMVRLRSFIVDKNYSDALSYLMAIPIDSLKPFEKLAFDGDGAEIAFGLIQEQFKNEDYPGLLKTYELFNKKYERKIGREPLIKYIVGKAFLKIGAYDSFDQNYEEFKLLKETPKREFPIWIDRDESISSEFLMLELAIIKNIQLENFDVGQNLLKDLGEKYPNQEKVKYFQAIVSFKTGKYNDAIVNVEKFLSQDKSLRTYSLSDIVTILGIYTDAIYKIGDLKKYRKVTKALLEDTKSQSQSSQYKSLEERILYLNIEILAGEQKEENALEIESEIKNFMNSFPNTTYKERVTFLLGQTYIQLNKLEEGEKIMKSLVESSTVPNYIKELARTELSFIKIKNKTI
jgi:tetratricopeptide (TPR) repeat protein